MVYLIPREGKNPKLIAQVKWQQETNLQNPSTCRNVTQGMMMLLSPGNTEHDSKGPCALYLAEEHLISQKAQ